MKATLSPEATLTLEEANAMASAAIAEARRLELAPTSVAVLDAAGTTKALQTEDRVALMRPQIATAKAWGCLGLGFSTQNADGDGRRHGRALPDLPWPRGRSSRPVARWRADCAGGWARRCDRRVRRHGSERPALRGRGG